MVSAWLLLLGAGVAALEPVRPEVIAVYPHDPEAYTQGLLLHEGRLYESTGLYGESSLREVELETGEVLRSHSLAQDEFGEGLARVGTRLVQLTWQEQMAHVYDLGTLMPIAQYEYVGEGWGLCFDGSRLVMSDGSDRLTVRDAQTFASLRTIEVTLDGEPLLQLNELECVGDLVWANVYGTDRIVSIDRASGRVTTIIDAAGLLDPSEAADADVLNGIAHDPETGRFFVTGKRWPKLFVIEVEGVDGGTDSGGTGDSGAEETGPDGATSSTGQTMSTSTTGQDGQADGDFACACRTRGDRGAPRRGWLVLGLLGLLGLGRFRR